MSMVRHVIYPPAKGLICKNFPLWKCETGGELRQLSTPTQEGEEEIVITPPPPPTKEAVRRAIEEVVGGRFDEDEDEEVSLEHLHALNNSRKRGWGDVPNEILNEGEEEVGENDDEEGVKIIEKPRPSKKARKQARGDQPPASLETSVEPSESEYPFPS
jgi:hypothetical protein